MSIKVISQVLETQLGNPTRKLIAMTLADYASEDGSGIRPAVDTVAYETEVSPRTVRRVISEFRKAKLLVLQREGGRGPKDPNVYSLDLSTLRRIHDGETTIDKLLAASDEPDDDESGKGGPGNDDDDLPPSAPSPEQKGGQSDTLKGGQSGSLNKGDNLARMTLTTDKGDTVSPKPLGTEYNITHTHSPTAYRESERVCVGSGDQLLSTEQRRVVEYFIRPLARSLRRTKDHTPSMLADMASELAIYPSRILKLTVSEIRRNRTIFPSIAQANLVCVEMQSKHFRQMQIYEGTPEWAVWRAHTERAGRRFQLQAMDRQGQISVDSNLLADLMKENPGPGPSPEDGGAATTPDNPPEGTARAEPTATPPRPSASAFGPGEGGTA